MGPDDREKIVAVKELQSSPITTGSSAMGDRQQGQPEEVRAATDVVLFKELDVFRVEVFHRVRP